MAEKRKKKVVKVDTPASSEGDRPGAGGPTWTPTAEANAQASKLRLFAGLLWLLAIGGEAFAIFWVLRQAELKMWLLILLIVVIGVLAVAGSMLWKKANRLDPASRSQPVKFFVQNQLGVIISIIAFVPLIIMIFLDKDMSGKEKGIAGTIGIVVAAIAALLSADFNPPSVEQYTEETNIVAQLTGKNEVFWTKNGTVFHVCDAVPDVNRESKDNQIYSGTVAQAHAAGMTRLTQRWEAEAINNCGYTQAQVDAVKAGNAAIVGTPASGDSGSSSDGASAPASADESAPASTEESAVTTSG